MSMAVRGRRIFLVMHRRQICILEHDGSRLLTKFHFSADKGLDKDCPTFRAEPGRVFLYPHPHLQDRFFAAGMGHVDMEPLSDDVASPGEAGAAKLDSPVDANSKGSGRVRTLLVREFHGDSPVAVYRHDIHKPHPSGLVLPHAGTSSQSDPSKVDNLQQQFYEANWGIDVLDGQDSFGTGSWSVGAPGPRVLDAAGLPLVPDELAFSTYQSSFNAVTKDFSVQRHLDPRCNLAVYYAPPWEQQKLIPWIPRPGLLRLRRLDALEADFCPTRVPGPESQGESEDGWTVELKEVEGHMLRCHRLYNDEDFTLLHMEFYDQFCVWSFVEDGEGD
ncbi:hypothetical protein IMZ48_24780 [Candidatus Bathyarchaeota archaeon]|nr:hypothetical protein [Candidatus Bathyarchaeota archaeon]